MRMAMAAIDGECTRPAIKRNQATISRSKSRPSCKTIEIEGNQPTSDLENGALSSSSINVKVISQCVREKVPALSSK